MCRHDNRLLRDTVAKFWRILPIFDKEGLGYLDPIPDCWFQGENNCESCLEKVVLTHRMGWPFVGKGFLGSPKKAMTYHPHHRKKQKEREKGEWQEIFANDDRVIEIRAYKPKRIPQRIWCECIKKVWEVDPLSCPKCDAEMKIISFIYKKTVIKKILTHLKLYAILSNQRAPPPAEHERIEPEIVPFEDGWADFEETVYEF